ncbi:unnamed protein product, partial [marine sediment metagenome]
WTGLTAVQVVASVLTSIEHFLYVPRYFEGKVIIEVSGNGAGVGISLYTFNEHDNTISFVATYPSGTGNFRIEIPEKDRHPFLIPVLTAISSGTVAIKAGFSMVRSS